MTSPTVPHKISVLEVEELRLVDKDGSSLARLARDRYGSFGLVIGESANGRPMLALTIAATGEPCIEICDRQGNCRALLQINHATGQVAMGLLDGNQQARAQVTVTADGHSTIGVYDPEHKAKAVMTNINSTTPLPGIISTFNSEGVRTWQSPAKVSNKSDSAKSKTDEHLNISFGRSLVTSSR